MTVLLPWPVSALSLQRPAAPGWRVLHPPHAALKPTAQALPSGGTAPVAAVGAVPSELSALGRLRPVLARQALGLRAGMAELVLLNRLRARTRRELCVDTLEQAARIIEVTARSWLPAEASPEPHAA